jgi:hypothetical protein
METDSYWRAIVYYYENSTGKIKIDGKLSGEFKIKDGVKQGGVLSPFFFNFYIDSLLDECLKTNIGTKLGSFNFQLFAIVMIISSNQLINQL